MKYKAVFFDFDGTLMDTSEGIFEGGRISMNEAGLPIPPDPDWRAFIGPPLEDCFKIVFGINDKDSIDELVAHYRAYYYSKGYMKGKFYPGIVDVLKELKRRGYKLGVATMKNKDLAEKMCRYFGISDLFDGIFGIDLGGTDKKSDILIKGFEKLGLKANECVLVGDTPIDAEGAEKAGCDCIKCDWGFGYLPGTEGAISRATQILDIV